MLERFRATNPKSEFTADVTRKLAVAYSETGQAGQAAVEFERIAMNPAETSDVQREANLTAADLYAKAGNTPKAVGMLERFVVTYPTPVADSVEARQKLADIAGTAGQADKQRYWQREIVTADRTAGAGRTDRTQYLAAKSQLALAAPARDEFRNIALVLPLKQSLAKKRKAMEAALGGYKVAADYRVAEVTTVATFEIAEIYRKLGQDIMKSERPKKLEADQLDEYNSLLEEQAFPFEEQAISTHEINTRLARQNVYDEGVKKSYAALAELKPGRYGKTEAAAAEYFDAPVPPPPPVQAASPSMATPADPTAAPVNATAPPVTPAPPPMPVASRRANSDFARALSLMRGRRHAGHPRIPGDDAVVSGICRAHSPTSACCIARPINSPIPRPPCRRPPNAPTGTRRPGPNTDSRCARPASFPKRAALTSVPSRRILPTRRRTAISVCCSTCSSMIR